MFWRVVAICILCVPVLGFGAGSVSDTRAVLEQWVKAQKEAATVRLAWATEREVLEASAEMFQQELSDLAGRKAALGEGNEAVERERLTLEAESAELSELNEKAAERAAALESRLPELLKSLPEVLQEKLKPLTSRLPQDPAETRLRPAERVQILVGILNEVEKFAAGITVESEVRKNSAGQEVEVETLYLGLSRAFFVGQGGAMAGVGTPGSGGWEWQEDGDLAGSIQKAIAIYRNQQPAAFVSLPVEIR